ncbi:unnamed protein product [Amoebophrya sp. A120]|nr:unnamed protein product [Amoebophrya sp. A120]|eukprot:GSA120T00008481001.1
MSFFFTSTFRHLPQTALRLTGATTAVSCEEIRKGEVVNWSGTRKSGKNAETVVVEDTEDLATFMEKRKQELLSQRLYSPSYRRSHQSGTTITNLADAIPRQNFLRPLGACLSPNGAGLIAVEEEEILKNIKADENDFTSSNTNSPSTTTAPAAQMLSCEKLRDIKIDKENMTITVGAGCTVQEVLETLDEQNLTLSNFSSVTDQTIAGWTQVGAHGTGVYDSTVDDMVVGIEVVTPSSHGVVKLDKKQLEGELSKATSSSNATAGSTTTALSSSSSQLASKLEDFYHLRCGLGLFGVVSSLTLKVVPKFQLKESIYVLTRKEVVNGHRERIRRHRHVRYHWIPWTEDVVVTVCDPVLGNTSSSGSNISTARSLEKMQPDSEEDDAEESSFAPERESYLTKLNEKTNTIGALDTATVKEVNQKEAQFWRNLVQKRGKRFTEELKSQDVGGGGYHFYGEPLSKTSNNRNSLSLRNRSARSGAQQDALFSDFDPRSSHFHWNMDTAATIRNSSSSSSASRSSTTSAKGANTFNCKALQRQADSKDILGFQCGGSQHVMEICFKVNDKDFNSPMTSFSRPEHSLDNDLHYMLELLEKVERQEIAAPSPIEQRWTKASKSYLSPCYSEKDSDIFTWIGVIMYRVTPSPDAVTATPAPAGSESESSSEDHHAVKMQSDSSNQETSSRTLADIENYFNYYAGQHLALCLRYNGVVHWGKMPRFFEQDLYPLAKACVKKRFGEMNLESVGMVRRKYDPLKMLGMAPWEY